MASAVLESFKSSFVHALSVTQPAALCDTCPLQQLHDLCQTIEGEGGGSRVPPQALPLFVSSHLRSVDPSGPVSYPGMHGHPE